MSAPLQLLGDPTRQRILQLIWARERSAGEIAKRLPVTFGATSQHLARLLDAGLVTVRRDGRNRYYRADLDALGPLAEALQAMWITQLKKLKTLAELDEHRPPRKGRRRRP